MTGNRIRRGDPAAAAHTQRVETRGGEIAHQRRRIYDSPESFDPVTKSDSWVFPGLLANVDNCQWKWTQRPLIKTIWLAAGAKILKSSNLNHLMPNRIWPWLISMFFFFLKGSKVKSSVLGFSWGTKPSVTVWRHGQILMSSTTFLQVSFGKKTKSGSDSFSAGLVVTRTIEKEAEMRK